MKIILASASPRRKEILSRIIAEFETVPSLADERVGEGLSPAEIVKTLARRKAEEVRARFPDAAVLGADTIVYFEGKVLGKPKDEEDAAETLHRLSGRTHSVYTGYCLLAAGDSYSGCVRTDVRFNKLSESFIAQYVASGSPLDKAGSYGIQDDKRLVKNFEGSYTNIVGLPEEEIRDLFKRVGLLE